MGFLTISKSTRSIPASCPFPVSDLTADRERLERKTGVLVQVVSHQRFKEYLWTGCACASGAQPAVVRDEIFL